VGSAVFAYIAALPWLYPSSIWKSKRNPEFQVQFCLIQIKLYTVISMILNSERCAQTCDQELQSKLWLIRQGGGIPSLIGQLRTESVCEYMQQCNLIWKATCKVCLLPGRLGFYTQL